MKIIGMKKFFSKINRLVLTTVALLVIYSCASGGSTQEAILIPDQTATVQLIAGLFFLNSKIISLLLGGMLLKSILFQVTILHLIGHQMKSILSKTMVFLALLLQEGIQAIQIILMKYLRQVLTLIMPNGLRLT